MRKRKKDLWYGCGISLRQCVHRTLGTQQVLKECEVLPQSALGMYTKTILSFVKRDKKLERAAHCSGQLLSRVKSTKERWASVFYFFLLINMITKKILIIINLNYNK